MPKKIKKKLIEKRIFIKPKKHKAIQAETDSVHSTVFQALKYASDSPKSVDIRRLAYEQYEGIVLETYARPMTEEDITSKY